MHHAADSGIAVVDLAVQGQGLGRLVPGDPFPGQIDLGDGGRIEVISQPSSRRALILPALPTV
jgi:hypothetical protein